MFFIRPYNYVLSQNLLKSAKEKCKIYLIFYRVIYNVLFAVNIKNRFNLMFENVCVRGQLFLNVWGMYR